MHTTEASSKLNSSETTGRPTISYGVSGLRRIYLYVGIDTTPPSTYGTAIKRSGNMLIHCSCLKYSCFNCIIITLVRRRPINNVTMNDE